MIEPLDDIEQYRQQGILIEDAVNWETVAALVRAVRAALAKEATNAAWLPLAIKQETVGPMSDEARDAHDAWQSARIELDAALAPFRKAAVNGFLNQGARVTPCPDPKARTLARGPRRYRRHVASPKQWQVLRETKVGVCRVCVHPANNGGFHAAIQLHHVVSREDHGDDYADNLVPLCPPCHDAITRRDATASRALLRTLSDAEYAYAIQRGGEGYFERAYGVRYER